MSDPIAKVSPMIPREPIASPSAGRTMTGLVRPWWEEYQRCVTDVEAGLAVSGSAIRAADGDRSRITVHRSARGLTGLSLLTIHFDLSAAWLRTHLASGDLASVLDLPDCDVDALLVNPALVDLAKRPGFLEFLPYMLDPHGEGTRKSAMRGGLGNEHRQARKANGVFFTPSDVASHMASIGVAAAGGSGFDVLDPACGTGVFLRAVFRSMLAGGSRPTDILPRLYGIDLDGSSIEACRLVLLAEMLESCGSPVADTSWTLLSRQLMTADSLQWTHRQQLSTAPGDASAPAGDQWPRRFGLVIGNPPYSAIGARADIHELRRVFPSLESCSSAANLFWPFADMMWLLTSDTGAACMVVPLSLAYSSVTAAKATRSAMVAAGGDWQFSFFDRTPDALFGDDVKQRNSIALFRAGGGLSVTTGPTCRWTSRTRAMLFDNIPRVDLGAFDIRDGIPKVGTAIEAEALAAIGGACGTLGEHAAIARVAGLSDMASSKNAVILAGTAYNWLSVFRSSDVLCLDHEAASSSPLTVVEMSSSDLADAAYAICSSKLAYWLWRVRGDCFHVPASFVRGLPSPVGFSPETQSRLRSLGGELWRRVSKTPIESVNKGRRSVTFSPWSEWTLVREVDTLLLRELGIPQTMETLLAEIVERNIVVDPSDQVRDRRRNRVNQ